MTSGVSLQVAYVMLDNGQKVSWQAPFTPWAGENAEVIKPPKFNSSPLKDGGWKTTFLLGR